MSILKKRNDEENEIERRIRMTQTKNTLSKFSKECEEMSSRYLKNAIDARKIKNDRLMRTFAARVGYFDEQVRKTKSLLLIISDLELRKEEVGMIKKLNVSMKDFYDIFSNENLKDPSLLEFEKNISMTSQRADEVGGKISMLVDSITENFLGGSITDPDQMEKIIQKIDIEAGMPHERGKEKNSTGADELEKRIDDGMKRILESETRDDGKV